ncbi:hypothetical protein [Olleya sp. Bg11-27]|uniref:hypothetical protein n=1 Tax=Olleya sp. Bg11-27 TaxID=2058135 RepID=UPI000C304C0B|nr:hypothetical protein [Olleya sp. Bg11-27]AUC77682.1 hypothetical protein CW732_19145 [Olleya sp. Bg11-27]
MKTIKKLFIPTLLLFSFLSFSQTKEDFDKLKNEITEQSIALDLKQKKSEKATAFLVELKNSDPKNSLIKQKTEEVEKLKMEVLKIKSNLYELNLKKEKLQLSLISSTSSENVANLHSLSKEIESKYQVHLLNEFAKKKFKNTKTTYKATILNTNFSIPIARFNFSKNDSLNKGNIQLFNSIGAGFGVSWGSMTDYRDENGELENSDFANTFSIHAGVLFSAGNNNNVFAPVISIGILDFQLGLGYELGNIDVNQKRSFVTIGYAIPLYKLVKGKYWFVKKSGIINEVKFDN